MKISAVLGAIACLIIGYFLSDYQNKKNNKRLIAAFKAELDEYSISKARTSNPSEIAKINEKQAILQANINLLQNL